MSPSTDQIIRAKAKIFVKRWNVIGNDLGERSDSQTFINEFFGIFAIDRQASNIFFEYKLNNGCKIDVFWPGVILIENKSPGKNLTDAVYQAQN